MIPSTHACRRAGLLAMLLLVASAAAPLAAQSDGSLSFNQLDAEVGIDPPLGEALPLDVPLVDADGQPVRLAECFADKPVILHLVYYECPMLCKLSSDGLMRAVETLSLRPGDDFTILTVSFDPREGPALSARARQMAAERVGQQAVSTGWHFLTGEPAALDKLCNAVGFRYKLDEKTGEYAHAAGAYILAADGTISRFLSGVDFSPRDLRLALVEASHGNVGTATDQVLLMCYMYDPTTGRYGMTIITAVRAGGIATVVVLAAAIAVLLRRERQQQAAGREKAEPGAPVTSH